MSYGEAWRGQVQSALSNHKFFWNENDFSLVGPYINVQHMNYKTYFEFSNGKDPPLCWRNFAYQTFFKGYASMQHDIDVT